MSLHAPLYCAICAAPCALPRADTPPQNTAGLGGPLSDTDTTSAPLSTSLAPGADFASEVQETSWLHRWDVLQVSTGICKPGSYTIISEPSQHGTNTAIAPAAATASSTTTQHPQHRPNRCIPIHSYCIFKIESTIRRSMYNTGFSHEANMMFGWSLPKWVGYGPWVHDEDRGGSEMAARMGERGWVGYWGGMVDQRTRWESNGRRQGGHLDQLDLNDPSEIGHPSDHMPSMGRNMGTSDTTHTQTHQTGLFLSLPAHIHTQIALHLLDLAHTNSNSAISPNIGKTPLANPPKTYLTDNKHPQAPLLDPTSLSSLLALTRTCTTLRALDLPSEIWRMLTLHSLHRWKLDILARWRANPTGVGSASQLWIALDEDFVAVVEAAVERTKWIQIAGHCFGETQGKFEPHGIATSMSGKEATARDVFMWWTYGAGWRSRRRVWSCVVHATATARDADWCGEYGFSAQSYV